MFGQKRNRIVFVRRKHRSCTKKLNNDKHVMLEIDALILTVHISRTYRMNTVHRSRL
jgi:hypothetical protein